MIINHYYTVERRDTKSHYNQFVPDGLTYIRTLELWDKILGATGCLVLANGRAACTAVNIYMYKKQYNITSRRSLDGTKCIMGGPSSNGTFNLTLIFILNILSQKIKRKYVPSLFHIPNNGVFVSRRSTLLWDSVATRFLQIGLRISLL